MITHLHLQNFLRHEDTELHFDPDQQLVVVAGDNGTGKSSIFHAVLWCLYGEAPKGRKVAELTRRGAELEGCQVDLTFTIGDDTYQVRRRRDGVKTSAILHVNDAPVCEGAQAVSAEVATLLGMDAAGFRVAFVAEQGELDGLASLQPRERAKMLSRLLRLDAIEAAKLKAREIYNNERRVVHALGSGIDLDQLSRDLEVATAERDLFAGQLGDARKAVAALDEQLAGSAATEAAYAAATHAHARAEAALEAALSELGRVTVERDQVQVPAPVDLPETSAAELADRLRELEGDLVRAESAAELLEQRAMAEREVDRATDRLAEINQELDEAAGSGDLQAAAERLAQATSEREEAALDLEDARDQLAAAQARVELASGRARDLAELDATCDRCGQEVDDDHRETMAAEVAEDLERGRANVAKLETVIAEHAERVAAADAAIAAAHELRADAVRAAGRVQALQTEQVELQRRRATYAATVERLPSEAVDVEALYAAKADLTLAHSDAVAAERSVLERAHALGRRDELAGKVAAAEERVGAARGAVSDAAPSPQLLAEHAAIAETKQARDGEMELVTHLAAEHAGAVERVAAAERDVERAHSSLERRRRHQLSAQTAENAAMLLGEVGEILATQIRPALQGAVSDLLGRLSDGRFTEARITDAYDVKVVDDGEVVDLASLSGGEQDLVALAVRLALAEVVTSRHGAGGIGTLVLDEVFGSQDASRQASIVAALRGLRDVYGQILLISHVGGIDEGADAVVTVATSPDRTETEVHVA